MKHKKLNDRVAELKKQFRKQTPKITEADRRAAGEMFKKHLKFEESKDKSIKNEMNSLAKDVGSFVYNATHGVGQLFNGFGDGKIRELKCHFCGEHCSDRWTNAKDGKWYGREHLQFSNLTPEQQERERVCLSTRQS